ncbi:hypothetical protein MRX96_046311 [Rhipicephalus microplus]
MCLRTYGMTSHALRTPYLLKKCPTPAAGLTKTSSRERRRWIGVPVSSVTKEEEEPRFFCSGLLPSTEVLEEEAGVLCDHGEEEVGG